jgi:hypothetical protein
VERGRALQQAVRFEALGEIAQANEWFAKAASLEGKYGGQSQSGRPSADAVFVLLNHEPPNSGILVEEVRARYGFGKREVYIWEMGPEFDGSSAVFAAFMVQYHLRYGRDPRAELQLDRLTFAEFEATMGVRGCVVAEQPKGARPKA